MTATVLHGFYLVIRLAAAGITKFHRGRTGLPLAVMAVMWVMLFTACTGSFIDTPSLDREVWFVVAGFIGGWFFQSVT